MIMLWSEDFAFYILTLFSGLISVQAQATMVILVQLNGQMFVVAVGLQEATTVVIGNSIGDNNPNQAKRFFKVTALIAWAVFISVASCLVALREPITALFTEEPDVTALSIKLMPVVGIKHVFDGIQGYL